MFSYLLSSPDGYVFVVQTNRPDLLSECLNEGCEATELTLENKAEILSEYSAESIIDIFVQTPREIIEPDVPPEGG